MPSEINFSTGASGSAMGSEPAETTMTGVLNQLSTAIQKMNMEKPPRPRTFSGKAQESMEDFFKSFERYARSVYSEDQASWLAVLPTYLEGEARDIVQAHGRMAEYELVKKRLLAEFVLRKDVASNPFTDFFATKRETTESLLCYSIRLEHLADRVRGVEDKEELVRSKFLGSLPEQITRQLTIQLGHGEPASLSRLVRLATILEGEDKSNYSVGRKPFAMQHVLSADLPAGAALVVEETRLPPSRVSPDARCYACGEANHFAKVCPRNQPRAVPSVKAISAPPSPAIIDKCAFCGVGDHTLARCRQFYETFRTCSWCSSPEHPSVQCPDNPRNQPSGNWRQPARGERSWRK